MGDRIFNPPSYAGVVILDTIQDLRKLKIEQKTLGRARWYEHHIAMIKGVESVSDGNGGDFWWDPANSEPDNNYDIVIPASNPPTGRWRRLLLGGGRTGMHNLLSLEHPDTVACTPGLGDILVGNSSARWQAVHANAATTNKFLRSYGNNTSPTAVEWSPLMAEDIPAHTHPYISSVLATQPIVSSGGTNPNISLLYQETSLGVDLDGKLYVKDNGHSHSTLHPVATGFGVIRVDDQVIQLVYDETNFGADFGEILYIKPEGHTHQLTATLPIVADAQHISLSFDTVGLGVINQQLYVKNDGHLHTLLHQSASGQDPIYMESAPSQKIMLSMDNTSLGLKDVGNSVNGLYVKDNGHGHTQLHDPVVAVLPLQTVYGQQLSLRYCPLTLWVDYNNDLAVQDFGHKHHSNQTLIYPNLFTKNLIGSGGTLQMCLEMVDQLNLGTTAATTSVNTSVFNKNLSSADDTVQKALNTIDDLVLGGGADTVVVNTSAFNKNLSAADNTVQKALNTIDDLNIGSSAPSGFSFTAPQLLSPSSSNWAINANAPLVPDNTNTCIPTRSFDDTLEEGVGLIISIPAGVTSMNVEFCGKCTTAPAALRYVTMAFYHRLIGNNIAVPAWSPRTVIGNITINANVFPQYANFTFTLSSAGLSAGTSLIMEFVRHGVNAGDTLVGDFKLIQLKISFS